MLINIRYHDETALNIEEVVKEAKRIHGKNVEVTVSPTSNMPYDLAYFAIQQLITNEQIALLFNNKETYQKDILALRSRIILKLNEVLDSVIIDNETRVT